MSSKPSFTTLMTFTYPHETAIVKSYLEAEGIEVFLKDEMSAQMHHFHSNAIGGIKLQVPTDRLPHATEVLLDGGFVTQEQLQAPKPSWVERLIMKFCSRR